MGGSKRVGLCSAAGLFLRAELTVAQRLSGPIGAVVQDEQGAVLFAPLLPSTYTANLKSPAFQIYSRNDIGLPATDRLPEARVFFAAISTMPGATNDGTNAIGRQKTDPYTYTGDEGTTGGRSCGSQRKISRRRTL